MSVVNKVLTQRYLFIILLSCFLGGAELLASMKKVGTRITSSVANKLVQQGALGMNAEMASSLTTMPEVQRAKLLNDMNPAVRNDVLNLMPPVKVAEYLKPMNDMAINNLVSRLSPAQAKGVHSALRRMGKTVSSDIENKLQTVKKVSSGSTNLVVSAWKNLINSDPAVLHDFSDPEELDTLIQKFQQMPSRTAVENGQLGHLISMRQGQKLQAMITQSYNQTIENILKRSTKLPSVSFSAQHLPMVIDNAVNALVRLSNEPVLSHMVQVVDNKELSGIVKNLARNDMIAAQSMGDITAGQVADIISVAALRQLSLPNALGQYGNILSEDVTVLPPLPSNELSLFVAEPTTHIVAEQGLYLACNAIGFNLLSADSASYQKLVSAVQRIALEVLPNNVYSERQVLQFINFFTDATRFAKLQQFTSDVVQTLIEKPQRSLEDILNQGNGSWLQSVSVFVDGEPVLIGAHDLVRVYESGAVTSVAMEIVDLTSQLHDLVNSRIGEQIDNYLEELSPQEIAAQRMEQEKSNAADKAQAQAYRNKAAYLDGLPMLERHKLLELMDTAEGVGVLNFLKPAHVSQYLLRFHNEEIARNLALDKQLEEKRALRERRRIEDAQAFKKMGLGGGTTKSDSGQEGFNGAYSLPIGFVALVEFVFSFDDEQQEDQKIQQQNENTRAKLYALCAEVIAQEAEQLAREQAAEADKNRAITKAFEQIEAEGVITDRYAEIIYALSKVMDRLPESVQNRLKQLPEFKKKTLEQLKAMVSALNQRGKMVIPIALQAQLALVLPQIKLSIAEFQNKTVPEIGRIIEIHAKALLDTLQSGTQRGIDAMVVGVQALIDAKHTSPETIYYVIAILKQQASAMPAKAAQGLKVVSDVYNQEVVPMAQQVKASVKESVDSARELASKVAIRPMDHKHAQQYGATIARKLDALRATHVTSHNLKQLLPADVEASPYLQGYVQAQLWNISLPSTYKLPKNLHKVSKMD